MVLALAVLAILLYFTLADSGNTKRTAIEPASRGEATDPREATERFTNPSKRARAMLDSVAPVQQKQAPVQQAPAKIETPVVMPEQVNTFSQSKIVYEKFENAEGIYDASLGAAPFGGSPQINTNDYAQVQYTGLVDANPNDIIQIEGTDLLTAPLVDNMLYTNSISNTNRNASQDLRGDISLTFNETYTPFYSSVIYGAPLSQKVMTLGSIESSGPVGPVGPFNRGLIASG
jgi:hypothetical protein